MAHEWCYTYTNDPWQKYFYSLWKNQRMEILVEPQNLPSRYQAYVCPVHLRKVIIHSALSCFLTKRFIRATKKPPMAPLPAPYDPWYSKRATLPTRHGKKSALSWSSSLTTCRLSLELLRMLKCVHEANHTVKCITIQLAVLAQNKFNWQS